MTTKPPLTATAAADLFRSAPDRMLDVGAGEVAVRSVGTGPDVLFIPGWPVSGATFRRLLPHLVEHVTCHVIDLPSAGSSRFDANTPLSIEQHIATVKRVVDLLELESVAAVGHDSGGLIARYALAGDPRLRSMGLINTEPLTVGWRFKAFVAGRHVPGYGALLGWVAGNQRVRRNPLAFGGAFSDSSLLDGEFDEFFLRPLSEDSARSQAAARVLKSFSMRFIRELPAIHAKIDVPVQLVWGAEDPFFPPAYAEQMVGSFPDAELSVIEGAGLFSHEERPAEVAAALLPALTTAG